MPTLHYRMVDVFTDRPFAGNPLAVVLDADDLDTADLQKIARQFNLSETAFPMVPAHDERLAGADYRLRIFTPLTELPFAGHPSIGAAWVLASLGRIDPGTVRQACGAGLLPLQVSAAGGPVKLTGGLPTIGRELEPVPVLQAASLPPGARLDSPVARVAGAGIDFVYLQLADDRDVVRAGPDIGAVRQLAAAWGAVGLDLFSWDAEARTAHCRVLTVHAASGEDPATGSAALGLGAYLVANRLLPADGESGYTVRQGAEIGRPSRLECTVVASGGAAVECRVSGSVVAVATGEIRRPPVRR
ncbi:MAG: trans-2,3-dihydro-3-hydroxyanthranilate isomerase [Frankiales bacterium]|nr:trans-2,3-dihydro-3-hydroxyanthranilate isomerase [Frankiales bacterium]